MYLSRLFVKDIGPIELVELAPPFAEDGSPLPLVLLGANGSGKTNILSTVADALFEFASKAFTDILTSTTAGRSYFRIVGSTTRRSGADTSISAMRFEDSGHSYYFAEQNGGLTHEAARLLLPDALHDAITWASGEERTKTTTATIAEMTSIFEEGAYCYFPSSRAERPDWLNDGGLAGDQFSTTPRFSGRLNKPLFVESGLVALTQWLMSLITEVRTDVIMHSVSGGGLGAAIPIPRMDGIYRSAVATFGAANEILQAVLGNPKAQFVWVERASPTKVGVAIDGTLRLSSLHSLSAGQATLLNIFGTLLRYADWSRRGAATTTKDVRGICIVDEIDAHMHIELQYKAIPKLISLFPNVQFLVSCHSPMCVLGLSGQFGEALRLVGLPWGREVSAEAYSEFEHALAVLKGTRAFSSEVVEAASQEAGRLLVWLEGETDPMYLGAAAKFLGRGELLEKVELAWIGAKEAGKQTNFNSGKNALNAAYTLMRANPGVVRRKVVLLYDADAQKPDSDEGNLHVRSMPSNPTNVRVRFGIENLLPVEVFTEDMFVTKETDKGNGSTTVVKDLDKMKLCKHLCEVKRSPDDFVLFASVLDIIEALAKEP